MLGRRSELSQTITVIVTGIIAWLVAAVIAIAIGARAEIIWTCVVGALLGATGLRYSIRRARRGEI